MTNTRQEIAGFRSDSASVNAVSLHYWIGGNPNGPPVLLWHGFLGTAYSWHRLMPLLADSGFRILVPDMRGYGDSDKPAGDVGYDGAALAEEFRSLVEQIGFGAGLGSLGVYRTAFATMAQTLPLTQGKVRVPVVAIGGEKGLGARVGQFVSMVAANVESVVVPDCGHFVPEECPEAILEQLDRLRHAKGAAK